MNTILSWVGFAVVVAGGLAVVAFLIDYAWERLHVATKAAIICCVRGQRVYRLRRALMPRMAGVKAVRRDLEQQIDRLRRNWHWLVATCREAGWNPGYPPDGLTSDEAYRREQASVGFYCNGIPDAERWEPESLLPKYGAAYQRDKSTWECDV